MAKNKNVQPLLYGPDVFTFWNKDVYIGEYANTPTQTRSGYGVQFTATHSQYLGQWKNENFLSGIIKFPDGTMFRGTVNQNKYIQGEIFIPGIGEIAAQIKDNFPSGIMVLKDIRDHIWCGLTDPKTMSCTLYPENQFRDPVAN